MERFGGPGIPAASPAGLLRGHSSHARCGSLLDPKLVEAFLDIAPYRTVATG